MNEFHNEFNQNKWKSAKCFLTHWQFISWPKNLPVVNKRRCTGINGWKTYPNSKFLNFWAIRKLLKVPSNFCRRNFNSCSFHYWRVATRFRKNWQNDKGFHVHLLSWPKMYKKWWINVGDLWLKVTAHKQVSIPVLCFRIWTGLDLSSNQLGLSFRKWIGLL